VGSPTGGLTDNTLTPLTTMLLLPDGTVLYSHMNTDLYVYQPGGMPVASGKPVISAVHVNFDGSYHLSGTGFNGISAGAAYGDDAQMDSNYPLVRLTDGGGNNLYACTHNWSSTGVMTRDTPVSTEFTLPSYLPPGIYSLVVIANGISSDPVTLDAYVWVDFNYRGGLQSGTYPYPYKTLTQGVAAVSSGGTIAFNANVQPSLSHETITISTPMTLISVGGSTTIGQ
jgi:hypothetical protein